MALDVPQSNMFSPSLPKFLTVTILLLVVMKLLAAIAVVLLLVAVESMAARGMSRRTKRDLMSPLHIGGIRDPFGLYCERRGGCCPGRDDQCTVPYLDTICYCDLFCNRTISDCCPDFWGHCLGISPPFIEGGGRTGREGWMNGGQEKKCTLCRERERYVTGTGQGVGRGRDSWQAANYSQFYGMSLDEGLRYRLGTQRPSRTIMSMNEMQEKEIMKEIVDNGPVQAILEVHEDFFVYKSGIYKHTDVSFTKPPHYRKHNTHSVRITGWGEERNYDGTTKKYWIAANSWGKNWGENGYFRITRGENECEIEAFVIGVWDSLEMKNMIPAAKERLNLSKVEKWAKERMPVMMPAKHDIPDRIIKARTTSRMFPTMAQNRPPPMKLYILRDAAVATVKELILHRKTMEGG
ncbi:unnamed protein product [Coregonus sp. 'balchen']|nr:unnamed protein product [Coregonus sp. 'balchen']